MPHTPIERQAAAAVMLLASCNFQNTAGPHLWMANSSASAATVFSPPDSWSISRYRLVGGIAVNLMPDRKGCSASSRLRYACPPTGCSRLFVSSCNDCE